MPPKQSTVKQNRQPNQQANQLQNQQEPFLSKEELLEKINSSPPSYKIIRHKSGTSEVWNNFMVVVDCRSEKCVGYVQCIKCSNFLKHTSKSGNSTLTRHADTCKNEGKRRVLAGRIKKKVTKLCVKLCAKDGRPFNVVSGEGFKRFAQELIHIGAENGNVDIESVLPHPRTVSRNVASAAEDLRSKVIPEVLKAMEEETCACTCDMWSDKHQSKSFLTVTSHHLNEKWELVNRVLILNEYPIDELHTGENIINQVEEGLAEIGIPTDVLKKVPFVTDQGANIKKAFTDYERNACMGHTISTVLRHTLDDDFLTENCPTTFKVVKASKKIVRYLKKSGKVGLLQNSVCQFLIVRWNTLVVMLTSIFRQHREIMDLLKSLGRKDLTKDCDIDRLKTLINFLEPFRKATDAVQAEKTPTSCLVVPQLMALKEHCRRENNNEPQEIALIKKRALSYLEEKVIVDSKHFVATFMVPELRHLRTLSESQRERTYDRVKTLCQEMTLSQKSREEDEDVESLTSSGYVFDGWEQAEEDVDEMAAYRNTGRPVKGENLLGWWRTRETTFPRLAKLAKAVFCIPATSAASERVFSRAGGILTEKRSLTCPQNVGDLVFYAINREDDSESGDSCGEESAPENEGPEDNGISTDDESYSEQGGHFLDARNFLDDEAREG